MKQFTITDLEDGYKLIKIGCLSLLDILNQKKSINVNIEYDFLIIILRHYFKDYKIIQPSDHYTIFENNLHAFDVLNKGTCCNIELIK